nr:MAG TPA: tail sheath tube [Caudoviricetes sp.]
MGYKHGTYQQEGATAFQLPVVLDYGHFIVGTAPIHKVKAENRKVNEVVRIGTYQEAIQYFGDTYDLDFSISQAIKVFFELYAVAPLYVVNILDLTTHKSEKKTLANKALEKGKVLIPSHKVIPESVVVKNATGKQVISDARTVYTAEGLEVYATVAGNNVDIEYEEVDLSKVTKTEAIGGFDSTTMKRTGLELANEIFLKYSELPAFIDVPDFSHESDVAAIMETKAKTLNGGMFEAIALVNAPVDKKYNELVEWKETNNILSNDQVLLYGKIKLAGEIYHQSIHYAALSMKVDGENNGVPSQGPSNYSYKMDAFVWKNASGKYEEVRLDKEQQANFLNKNGVVTAINFKGWRCWGSETAKNPLATDPKDKYIYGRRMFKYIGNELVISYFNNVDKKFSLKMAETMKKSMNIRLNALVAADQLLSAKVNFYAEDNSLIDIINGDITWTIELGIIPGAKSITFKKVYDVDALQKFAESLTA